MGKYRAHHRPGFQHRLGSYTSQRRPLPSPRWNKKRTEHWSQLGSPNVKEAWRPVAMKVSFEGWFVPETSRNQQKPAETAPWDHGSEVEAIVNSLPTAIPICLGSKISKSAVGEILVISRHLHIHVVAEDGWAAIGRNGPQELDVIRSHLRSRPVGSIPKPPSHLGYANPCWSYNHPLTWLYG